MLKLASLLFVVVLFPRGAIAQEAADPTAPTPDARETAVALNYCRAAFHRIRKQPTRDVLAEEQDKILNNINLDGIADREVIQLYSSVLDEINQVSFADYERKLVRGYHNTTMQKKIVWDVLAIGADAATGQYGNAVRSGANSWWDYRAMSYNRDRDLLKIDRARMTAVVEKSSQFLDTFWQMAQKKHIPDRWLVRADDLDALDEAMQERDAEVRLRVLKRMDPFMEAYPPYLYYLARTQQELGQLFAASNTYSRLVDLGDRHFRKDDMLATGLANRAAIQDYLGQSDCVASAERALRYSTEVWEANLVCARILQRHEQFAAAEDAILRNLDVELESEQSRVFLVALYEVSGEHEKLLQQLSDPQIVAGIPAPVLLRCAAALGQERTPPHVLQTVVDSLEGHPRVQFGPDDFVLTASSGWLLNLAVMRVVYRGKELPAPEVTAGNGYYQLRYAGQFDWGNPLGQTEGVADFEVRLSYPDRTEVRLALGSESTTDANGLTRRITARPGSSSTLRISSIEVGTTRVATNPDPDLEAEPVSVDQGDRPVNIPLPPREATRSSDLQ